MPFSKHRVDMNFKLKIMYFILNFSFFIDIYPKTFVTKSAAS